MIWRKFNHSYHCKYNSHSSIIYLSSIFILLIVLLIPICSAEHCNNELIHHIDDRGIRITSSSHISKDKSAQYAILHGSSAWSAAFNDLSQYIEIDLGRQFNISAIGTQGRQNTMEFVQEFKLESGIDGHDYNIYRDRNGNIKLFQGNTDGNSVVINRFDPPIIAQFVRINPTRWRDRISLRLQLYGCDYHAISLNFDGKSFITMNLDFRPILASIDDVFRFRFRTNEANGTILYATGVQGDLLALQLINNKLLLSLDLGENVVNSISAGSLLDDNLWHDVFISRQARELTFSVDRVIVKHHMKADFTRLDLANDLYIGGLPDDMAGFFFTKKNFTGCIENLSFNTTNIAHEIQNDKNNFLYKIFGNIHYSCQFQPVIPITFNTRESHINVLGNMNNHLNTSLDFRTFNDYGMLIYHQFSIKGFFVLYLKNGQLAMKIQGVDPVTSEETPLVSIEPFDSKLNDGSWHNVQIAIQRNKILLSLDGLPSSTIRSFQMQTGQKYIIGGGVPAYRGFIGCMRWIYIENRFINPEMLSSDNIYKVQENDITIKSCQMIDRCHPNPCEHKGVCKQNHLAFVCDCGDSGYFGAVCHVPRHPFSCTAFMIDNPDKKREDIKIDIDGSGPLEPFWVTCLQTAENRVETVIHHQNESPQKVQGFLQPGSYIQDIKYDASMAQMAQIVNRSDNCRQKLKYECKNARLLNSPSALTSEFNPFTWWVSRDNKKMDYWAGGLPGTRKCECGLYGNCYDPKKFCNCDSASNEVLVDEGVIIQKEYLPVRQIRIGDTRLTSQTDESFGRFTLGALICDGDSLFQDIVTFRYMDATIDIPLVHNFEGASDIYLQFKTTIEFGVFFHATGPEDFIKLAIVGGRTIQFSYSSGTGLQQVSIESPFRLNDNQWHSILVEKNKKEARLVVDGRYTNENRENADNSFPLYLTSYLVIGATTEYREGYLGCMRSLVINGVPVELKKYAHQGFYGIHEGCVGKCESNPCLNNGTCIEEYNGYSCDCQWTAFKGPICADEIGVNLRSDNYIRYDFETSISTLEEYIRVGFTTTEHRGLIFGISSRSGEYLNLLMSSSGHLRLVFDFGFERQEIIIKEENFALGQHHDITIKREDKGSKVVIFVDNYEPKYYTFKIDDKAEAQFSNLESIYIGRNGSMDSGEGFIGCISRVIFDDHFPLRRLYQENKRSNVQVYPSNAEIFEDKCGIEPPTHPPDILETRPPPRLPPGVVMPNGFSSSSTSAIIGGFLAALLVLLLLFCFASSRFIARQKGEYVTHEDQGADSALDPDTAVIKGTTGPDVSVKREYFI